MFNRKSVTTVLIILLLGSLLIACDGRKNVIDSHGEDIIADGVRLDEGEVFRVFTEKYPGIRVKKIALKEEGTSGYSYEIEGYNKGFEYEEKMDAEDGRSLDSSSSISDKQYGEIDREDLLQLAQYLNCCLDDLDEDFVLNEWEMELDDGRKMLELELVNSKGEEVSYIYDMDTGRPVRDD